MYATRRAATIPAWREDRPTRSVNRVPSRSGSARPVGPPALLRRKPPSRRERTAVDVDRRTGDELRERRREEHCNAGDVGGLTEATERNPRGDQMRVVRTHPLRIGNLQRLRDVGRDRVHPYAVARVFDGERARETGDRSLERGIDGTSRNRSERLDRRDVDDAATLPLFDEVWKYRTRTREHVREVHAV